MSRHRVGERRGGDHERVDREPSPDHDAQYPGAPEGIPSAAEAMEGGARSHRDNEYTGRY
jgi:hypothetical protein